MRITVVASMRNEGPFIVEWVTWYRMLGFSDIVVVTNDCTDASPALLDALETAGWVHHLRCDVPPGKRITHRKLKAATDHKAVRRADWLLVCDVDEFLVIHKGSGQIHELIGTSPDDVSFLAMALNWRIFGTNGVRRFIDRPVHQQFVAALPLARSLSNQIKMLHRQPRWFRSLGEHGPRGWNLARHGRSPEDPGMGLVNARSEPVPGWSPAGPYMRRLLPGQSTHEVAQMNHYMLRSSESYSLKEGTRAPVANTLRYTETYRRRAEAVPQDDDSAGRYAKDFAALHAKAMALPDVARLHALCCADHLRLIAEKRGSDADTKARRLRFLAQAGALAGGKAGDAKGKDEGGKDAGGKDAGGGPANIGTDQRAQTDATGGIGPGSASGYRVNAQPDTRPVSGTLGRAPARAVARQPHDVASTPTASPVSGPLPGPFPGPAPAKT